MTDDTTNPYPEEKLDEDEDNGTMVDSKKALEDAIVGHKIAKVYKGRVEEAEVSWRSGEWCTVIELDDGRKVKLVEQGDCCAGTEVHNFLLHPDKVEHAILGVGTTEEYTKWHIFADYGDVLELEVGWSCGNPFYYSYGFDIVVEDIPEGSTVEEEPAEEGVARDISAEDELTLQYLASQIVQEIRPIPVAAPRNWRTEPVLKGDLVDALRKSANSIRDAKRKVVVRSANRLFAKTLADLLDASMTATAMLAEIIAQHFEE